MHHRDGLPVIQAHDDLLAVLRRAVAFDRVAGETAADRERILLMNNEQYARQLITFSSERFEVYWVLDLLFPHEGKRGRRRSGLGGALLARACVRARNWGQHALFVYCLGENEAMMSLARKQGMAITGVACEAHAWLELPPADAASFLDELSSEALARLDLALKAQLGYTVGLLPLQR